MVDMKRTKEPTVLTVINLGSASGRDMLSGVFDYVNEGHRWNIRVMQDPHDFTEADVRALAAGKVDGVIARLFADSPVCRALAASPVPAVINTDPAPAKLKSVRNTTFLRLGNLAIGEEAARYFASRGAFRSYGFYSRHAGLYWSDRREQGFLRTIRQGEHTCSSLHDDGASPSPKAQDWVRRLPKPAAVFAACDDDALALMETCRAAEIAIPDQLALLGVDNDEFLCSLAKPPLSSIEPDHVGIGHIAAQELTRLLSGRACDGREIELTRSVKRLVERGSSRGVPPAGHLIREALAFIRRNACAGIGPKDVAEHLGVSRRLMDLRFRQIQKRTVLETILDIRLAEVKRRLERTSEPLGEIARDCGFGSAARLANVFRAHCGKTMLDWRRAARA